jgi:phosphopantetheinyl transferase
MRALDPSPDQDRRPPEGLAGVRVIWLDLDSDPAAEAELSALLIPSEAERVGRIRSPVERRRAMVRLVRRRQIVADEIGVSLSEVMIGTEPGGRPYVQRPD